MNYTQRRQYRELIRWLDAGYPGFYRQFEHTRACLRRLNWPEKQIYATAVIILKMHFPGFGEGFHFYSTQLPDGEVPWLPLVWTLPLMPQSVPESVRVTFSARPKRHPYRTYDGWRRILSSQISRFERLLVARPTDCIAGRRLTKMSFGDCSSDP
jgi:hypothetical protein